jgi:two-component system, response regulator RegA
LFFYMPLAAQHHMSDSNPFMTTLSSRLKMKAGAPTTTRYAQQLTTGRWPANCPRQPAPVWRATQLPDGSQRLQAKGYEVYAVNSLEAVLPAVAAHTFDTILLDLMLAEKSSLNLIPAILQQQPTARITVVTGFASIATTVRAIKMGAVGYLAKPVGIGDIISVLHPNNNAAPVDQDTVAPMPLRQVEWEHIQRVLTDHDGNISAAARSLGLHRRSLQRKLSKKPPG